MSAVNLDSISVNDDSLMSDDLYRVFVHRSIEAIWRIEFDAPIDCDLPPDRQVERIYAAGFLAECNEAMAAMYGYTSVDDIVGLRLVDFHVPNDPANIESLKAFIAANYRINGAESHELDRDGNVKFFLNDVLGIVENKQLVRIWGSQRDVTESREIERSKAHLAAIVESSDDAIVSKDLNGIITSWNRGAESIFGYSADEAIGQSITMIIPEHLRDEEKDILSRVRRGDAVRHFETIRQRKDGAIVHISLTVSPIRGKSGEIIGASKIARDIGEKKESESRLEESRAILGLSMQSGKMGYWTHDLMGQTIWWSPELEEIFGIEKGSFKGGKNDFRDFIHIDDRDEIWRKISSAMENRREYTIEFRFNHAGGTVRWMEGRGRAVYSESGEPLRLYGIGIDITDRKNSERQLRESEELYRTLFNSIDEGFAVIQLIFDDRLKPHDYRFLEVNPVFEKFTGLVRPVGRTAREMVPNLEDRWFEIYGQVALSGEPIRFTEGSDAMGRWFDVYAVRVGDAESRRIAVIFSDITERRKAEDELRESEERFSKAFNSSPLVLTITSLKTGCLIEVNETFEKMSGFSRAEAIGKTTAELGFWVNPPDREQELGALQKKGELRDLEFTFRKRDGAEVVGMLSAEILDIRGEPCALTLIQDISLRKKAEVISERYRQLSMRASDIILFLRPDGEIVDANQAAVTAYGYELTELLGMSLTELREPATRGSIPQQLKKANDGGGQWETVHIRKDGTTFPVDVTSVGADIGDERLLINIIRDVTERNESEVKLRQSAKQLALVTDIAPVYIAHCGEDRRFRFVNKPYAERFGLTPSEVVGKKISEIIGQSAFESIRQYVDIVLAGESVEFDLELAYPSIGDHFMHCCYAPEFDDSGNVIGWVAALTDITDRRELEKAISRSETELRQMANSMPQVVWIAQPDGVVTYYNDRVLEFLGAQKQNDGNWNWQPILHQDDLAATVHAWQTAIEKKQNYVAEHRVRMSEGAYRWHLSRAFPAYDEYGNISRWYGTATDIHDLKQTEEALRESERRFRTMTNNAPMLVWMSGSDQRSSYFNQTWLDFTGKTMAEEIGDGWMSGIHPDDLERCTKTYDEAFDSREQFEIEYRLRRFDGEYRWILDKGVPLLTHNGNFLGYIGSCFDVTERREGQAALLKAERRASEEYLVLLSRIVPLAQTLGTSRDLISIYRALQEFVVASMPTAGFFISFFNSASRLRTAAYVWGEEGEVDTSTLPSLPITENGGPNSQAILKRRTIVVDNYWEMMRNRPHVLLQDNGENPNSSLVVPMTVMNRVIGTLEVQSQENNGFRSEHIIVLEMAANLAAVAIENVRLLQVEADARETAEAANRAKDEFLSVLSHELRTPLNSMLGWTRMLRSGVLDEAKTAKAIEVIERNTLLQNNLIEDLLDVSRIISGKMRIESESVELVRVFGDAIDFLRPVAAQKQITFNTETSEKSLVIEGDATRFHQILVNLVQNAIKFTPDGGRVDVTLSRRGNNARLVVEDTGIGIAEELLPHIFERFRQADSSTKRAYSGLGLGLTIVSNLVQLHGGTLKANSDGEGKGAVFTVEIPLAAEFLKGVEESKVPLEPLDLPGVLSGARILLVDDDRESLQPLQLFLEKELALVTTAGSAGEALGLMSAGEFDILVTDIGMPQSDGYELISRIRNDAGNPNQMIAAVALTAYASSDDRRRALSSGFQSHFSKPVNFDEFLLLLKKLFDDIMNR